MNPNAPWSPKNPDGDLIPLLSAAIEDARSRHPSGKDPGMNATPIPAVLTAADRCDRCGAAAVYRMLSPTRPVHLDMCAHHWREKAPAMFDQGWVVVAGNPEELQGAPS